jgi:hypothetical protein
VVVVWRASGRVEGVVFGIGAAVDRGRVGRRRGVRPGRADERIVDFLRALSRPKVLFQGVRPGW